MTTIIFRQPAICLFRGPRDPLFARHKVTVAIPGATLPEALTIIPADAETLSSPELPDPRACLGPRLQVRQGDVVYRRDTIVSGQTLSRWLTWLCVAALGLALSGCFLTKNDEPDPSYVKTVTPPEPDPARERLASRMEELEKDLRSMRDIVERMQAAGGHDRPQALADLQQRVSIIEGRLGMPRHTTGAPITVPPPSGGAVQPNPPGPGPEPRTEIKEPQLPQDERAFREAYTLATKGNSEKAIPLLQQFLKDYSKSQFAADAHYWLGESLMARNRPDEAVLEFDKVVKEFPESKKLLDAMLKQAEAFKAGGDPSSARIKFQAIVRDYPHTPQARQARVLIKSLPPEKSE